MQLTRWFIPGRVKNEPESWFEETVGDKTFKDKIEEELESFVIEKGR